MQSLNKLKYKRNIINKLYANSNWRLTSHASINLWRQNSQPCDGQLKVGKIYIFQKNDIKRKIFAKLSYINFISLNKRLKK